MPPSEFRQPTQELTYVHENSGSEQRCQEDIDRHRQNPSKRWEQMPCAPLLFSQLPRNSLRSSLWIGLHCSGISHLSFDCVGSVWRLNFIEWGLAFKGGLEKGDVRKLAFWELALEHFRKASPTEMGNSCTHETSPAINPKCGCNPKSVSRFVREQHLQILLVLAVGHLLQPGTSG